MPLSSISLMIMLKNRSNGPVVGQERGLKAHRRPHDQGLFGIVQGLDLKTCAVSLLKIWSAWTSQAILSVA